MGRLDKIKRELIEESNKRMLGEETDQPKHSITKTKNTKSGKGNFLKKLFNKFNKKSEDTEVIWENPYTKKYGEDGTNDITSETYRYTSNEMKNNEEGSSETIFLNIHINEEKDFLIKGSLPNTKKIIKMVTLNVTLGHNVESYGYFNVDFYSDDKHLDTLTETKKGTTDFICSVNTLDGKTGSCNLPEEMINIIKEKLLPTEYGNEIKSNLQNIGITI